MIQRVREVSMREHPHVCHIQVSKACSVTLTLSLAMGLNGPGTNRISDTLGRGDYFRPVESRPAVSRPVESRPAVSRPVESRPAVTLFSQEYKG